MVLVTVFYEYVHTRKLHEQLRTASCASSPLVDARRAETEEQVVVEESSKVVNGVSLMVVAASLMAIGTRCTMNRSFSLDEIF